MCLLPTWPRLVMAGAWGSWPPRSRSAHVTRTRTNPGPCPGLRVIPRARGPGDQPADVSAVLGWLDAADVKNPLCWLRAPPHLWGRRGARRRAVLLQTREPGQGFPGFDSPPGARPWFPYQPAGETARLPVRSLGPAGRRNWKEPIATVGLSQSDGRATGANARYLDQMISKGVGR